MPRSADSIAIQSISVQRDRTQLIQKIQEVTSDTDQTTPGNNDDCLEQLDQQWTLGKINAEHHCRKLNTGTIPWTPSLTLAIYKVLYWKGLQKRLKGSKISGTGLRKRANQGGETFLNKHLKLLAASILQKIKTAIGDYRGIKKQGERREIWMEEMIQAQADARNTTKSKLWKKVK